jgi:hypothetical protein
MFRSRTRIGWLLVLVGPMIVAGCDSSDVLEVLVPNLQGAWVYAEDNPDDALFVECSEDLLALEGLSVSEARTTESLCIVGGTIDVLQVEEIVTVNAQVMTCSDGATALLSGFGTVGDTSVSGQWLNISDGAVTTVQDYSGTVLGNLLIVEQTALSVSGSQSGTCGIAPPLSATIMIN